MNIFLHYQLDKIEGFLKRFKELHKLYSDRNFQFTEKISQLYDLAGLSMFPARSD